MGDHLAADLGKATAASLQEEKSLVISANDVAGNVPSVPEFLRTLSAKVASDEAAAAEGEEAAVCARHFREGFRVEEARGDAWKQASSAALPRSLLDFVRPNAEAGPRQVETYDGRSFREAIAFEDLAPEARTKGNAKIGWKLFSSANDTAQCAKGVAWNTLEVLAQKGGCCQDHRGSVCTCGLR
jgi:hypothetical protein